MGTETRRFGFIKSALHAIKSYLMTSQFRLESFDHANKLYMNNLQYG